MGRQVPVCPPAPLRQEPHTCDLFLRHLDFGGKYLEIVTLHNHSQIMRSLFGHREWKHVLGLARRGGGGG